MATRNELLDQLKCLTSAQFDEVLFRLEIETWLIPPPFAEQGLRATAVMRRIGQEDDGLNRLKEILANRAIKTIGKKYDGYETEAEVRKIVSEYTVQPLAGRSEEQEYINQFIDQNTSGVLLLTAAAGFGKSSLLMHWQQTRQEDCFIAFHCFRTSPSVLGSVPNAYRHLLRQLYVYYNRREEMDDRDLRSQLRGLVDDAKAQPNKRLVIVLDGLDEAQETFEPFLSFPLPDGVYVIASARADQGDTPKYLKGWADNAKRLPLNLLPREAISEWVKGVDELATYAQDSDFVGKLDDLTAGFPLYLSYLVDDLKQAVVKGNDVQVLLQNTSPNFTEYVKSQFDELANLENLKNNKETQKLFSLLSVALGLLSKDDIQKLVGINAWGLAALPWQATRWFSRYKDFYGFSHPLLAQEFRSAIGADADSQEGELIDYCANWQENQSPYALRYYADHLWKAKQWEILYDLARDKAFANAQRQGIREEPELLLKTLKLALQSKAEADEAGGMAEFLVLHAKRKIEIAQESPLDALRAGSLERAWKLAGEANREDCILWHLLLAWALVTENSPKSARETLEQLQSISLSGLLYWKADCAVYLLGQLLPALQHDYLDLIQKLLPDEMLGDLWKEVRKAGQSDALEFIYNCVLQLDNSPDKAYAYGKACCKAYALSQIAIAQAEAEDAAAAQTTLNTALDTVLQLENSPPNENSPPKAYVLSQIASAQFKAGDAAAARTTLNKALTTTQQLENSPPKAYALSQIAIAQAEAGDAVAAQTTLNTALTIALQLENPSFEKNLFF